MGNEKHADIVAEVKAENPAAEPKELAKLVNDRIRSENGSKTKPVLAPLNPSSELSPSIRGQAENISERDKLMVEFIRPKGEVVLGAKVNFVSGDIKKVTGRKAPVGALVAFTQGPKIMVGWSKYYKPVRDNDGKITTGETEPFTKKDATLIAIMRALTDGIKGNVAGYYETSSGRALPRAINKAIDPFAKRAAAYFKREFENLDFI